MVNLIKKLGKAAVSLLLGCFSLGCSPEGMPVKGNYPELTPTVQQSLEERFFDLVDNNAIVVKDPENYPDSEVPVVAFEDFPKEFINYFFDFLEEDFENEGVELGGIDNLRIAIATPEEIEEICGASFAQACRKSDSGVIVMPDNFDVVHFLQTFFHEYGHSLYGGNKEFPSIAAEKYLPLKAMQFDKKIGSFLVDRTVGIMRFDDISEVEPYFRMYALGRLFVPLNLAMHNGSIPEAIDYVTHAYLSEIELALDSAFKGIDGGYRENSFELWKEVLNPEIFANIGRGNLSEDEIKELRDYLEISLYSEYLSSLKNETESEAWDRYLDLVRTKIAGNQFTNKVLEAKLVRDFNFHAWKVFYKVSLRGCLDNGQEDDEDSEDAYEVGQLLWEVNKSAHCNGNTIFDCPAELRNPSRTQVEIAYELILSRYGNPDDAEKVQKSVNLAVDFLEYLFPGVDIRNEVFAQLGKGMLSRYVAPVGFNAGYDALERLGDRDLAKKLFKAAAYGKCYDDNSFGPDYEYCQLCQKYARDMLDNMNNEDGKVIPGEWNIPFFGDD